jgi:hypothetical protein
MDKGTPAIGRDGGDYSFAFAKGSHRIQRLGISSS